MFRQLWRSFCHAFDGFRYCLQNERNFRVHMIAAITVMGLSLLLDFSVWERLALLFTITFVWVCEMLNTALEATLDLITKETNPLIKVAKDVSAGAVLVSALGSVIVALLLFFSKERCVVYLEMIRNNPKGVFLFLLISFGFAFLSYFFIRGEKKNAEE